MGDARGVRSFPGGALARFSLAFALLTLVSVSGCVLERRPDAEVAAESDDPDVELPPAADPSEAVRITLEVFREAVRVGDLSLALGLLDRQAVLFDELAGPGDAAPTRGELLLELRRRHAAGLRLEVEASEVHLADQIAVVVNRLGLLRRPTSEGEEPVREGEARETIVLVASPEGWRILHLHRSVVTAP